jgi:L-fuconolactonase
MHIDAHQHFWIYRPEEYEWIDDSMAVLKRDFLPRDLDPELRNCDFEGSVAVQARQSLEETRWLLELAERSSTIRGVVGWVDVCSPGVHSQLVEFSKNPKFVGVRHIVQAEPDDRFLMRTDFQRGIAMLEDFDLAFDILIYPRHLPGAAEFVERFPRQRFVLDHMAKPPIKSGEIESWTAGIRRLAEFPNVSCKLSGLVTEADWQNWTPAQITPYLDVAFAAFRPRRLMIGSDWPVCLAAAPYDRATGLIQSYVAGCSPDDREAILGGNAQQFWRLKA